MKENYVATNLEQDFTDREKAQARTNIGAQAQLTAGTNITIDANNVISAAGGVFIATYNSTTYTEIANALAAGNAVILRYGNADIPISSSTSTRHTFLQVRRDEHSYSQQSDSTRAFVVASDNTWSMNSVPVSYNIIAGAGLSYTINDNDLTLSVSAVPQIGFIQHNQDVTLRTGQFVNPERYNLNCYIPARTNFYGSITIDNIYTNDPQAMYNFTLYVPGNDMDCIFGTYPQLPSCGHNINFVVNNTATTQYQLYFALSGTFVSQEIEVKVRGITVSM